MLLNRPEIHPSLDGSQIQQQALNRLSIRLGRGNDSLERRIRLAVQALTLDDTPLATWRKILPTIPDGISTTRSNEMFCWARDLILDQEREQCASEAVALQNTGQRLLSANVY